jgi:isoquinoline 1-oxidoreductase beta subunit
LSLGVDVKPADLTPLGEFESHILPYDNNPTGVGEIGLPTAAPALTSAIFAATGVRITELSIRGQLREFMLG